MLPLWFAKIPVFVWSRDSHQAHDVQDTATADVDSAPDLLSVPLSPLESSELNSWPVESAMSAESAEAHSSPFESDEVHSGLAETGLLRPTSHPASSRLALQQAALPLICLVAATVGLALFVRLLYRCTLVCYTAWLACLALSGL